MKIFRDKQKQEEQDEFQIRVYMSQFNDLYYGNPDVGDPETIVGRDEHEQDLIREAKQRWLKHFVHLPLPAEEIHTRQRVCASTTSEGSEMPPPQSTETNEMVPPGPSTPSVVSDVAREIWSRPTPCFGQNCAVMLKPGEAWIWRPPFHPYLKAENSMYYYCDRCYRLGEGADHATVVPFQESIVRTVRERGGYPVERKKSPDTSTVSGEGRGQIWAT